MFGFGIVLVFCAFRSRLELLWTRALVVARSVFGVFVILFLVAPPPVFNGSFYVIAHKDLVFSRTCVGALMRWCLEIGPSSPPTR